VAGVVSLCFFQTQAFAHADLKASTPAPGSSIAEVKEIRLGFDESVNPKFSGADLKDGAGKSIATGPATLDSKKLIVPVSGKLEPGNYTIEWHAVASDSHRVKGQFSFKVTQ
jgi:methionine-rich copper-binding protein CopC